MLVQFVQAIVIQEALKLVGGNIPGFFTILNVAESRVAVDIGSYYLVREEKTRGFSAYFPGASGRAENPGRAIRRNR